MYNTLNYFEDQNSDFNRLNSVPNFNDIQNSFNYNNTDNYFGKGNLAIDQYNMHKKEATKAMENDAKFKNTKNKIKLIVYKNGFILNNGEFRDRSIPENGEFLDEVDKGQIPQELIRLGIKDLGILLVNRKNEIYQSPLSQNINPIYSSFNYYQNPFQFQNDNTFEYFPNQTNSNDFTYNGSPKPKPKINMSNVSQTPMGMRNNPRNNIFYSTNTEKIEDRFKNKLNKNNNSKPNDNKEKKDNDKKFVDLLDLKKDETEKSKFTAFSGSGKLVGNINFEGLQVNKDIKSFVDYLRPMCVISIRLFNGEIVKSQFNYSQTLADIYLYVRRLSGSNNFVLLDGFPPRPLIDYYRSIGELGLQNTVLTQKIN